MDDILDRALKAEFAGARCADATRFRRDETLIRGTARDGAFRTEGSRFDEGPLDAPGRAKSFGRDAEPAGFEVGHSRVVAPAVGIPEFHFTGVRL